MKLLITTQVYENYGAHDWDGAGECPQYWKAKGGSDYVIRDFDPLRYAPGVIVDLVRPKIESDSEYFREHIIDWSVEADDYLTEFEQMQLDYEGQIRFPVKELELA
jgi:hypothetical protein